MRNQPRSVLYDWMSAERYWLGVIVSPVFIAVGCMFFTMTKHYGWRITGVTLISLGLLMLIRKQSIFNKSQGLIHVCHRFLSWWTIWKRTFRVSDYDAVIVECRTSHHASWPRAERENFDIYYRVGLRRKLGRSL